MEAGEAVDSESRQIKPLAQLCQQLFRRGLVLEERETSRAVLGRGYQGDG